MQIATRFRRRWSAWLALTACLALTGSPATGASPGNATLAAISEAYFAAEFRASPVFATETGVHDYDAQLDDVSPQGHAARTGRLEAVLAQVTALDAATLSPIERDDREIFIGWIHGQLLEEQTVQLWRHDPNRYVVFGLNAVNWLIIRSFASPAERLSLVIARERLLPRMLHDAEANLTAMPPVYIEMALENLAGAAPFLERDVPAAFASVNDPRQQTALRDAAKEAVAAFERFRAFLEMRKPTAHGQFAIGRDAFVELLRSSLVDATPEQVLAAGEAQLKRDRAAFDRVSAEIDRSHPERAYEEIGADHPTAAQLVSTVRAQVVDLRRFIEQKHIATLPPNVMPTVEETPAFRRAAVFGELDWPGPLETRATESYYYITPPNPADPPAEQDKMLRLWNRYTLQTVSVHEALPGHFLQGIYRQSHSGWSMIRQVIHVFMAEEGWAHYTEQMMVDEGLDAGNPRARLAQLNMALLRDCRLVDAVKMHVEGVNLADATRTMREACAIPEVQAYREARRGTEDPGYFCYALGKLEILKLREDVRKEEGATFSLQRFHDRFLAAGLVPIMIIRRELLGRDDPSL